MSIEAAAELVAGRLLEQEFVHVYGHHDADGIAAASILCHALLREGKRFQLTIRSRISPDDIAGDESVLLCDFGASLADLPDDVIVVDHHIPHFEGEYHVNPHLAEIDGDRELSASGTAYLVARHMTESRDLAGIALLGIIGDRQDYTGKNREILNEGIANGYITTGRGIRLPGRERSEQLYMAIHPWLEGISGDESGVAEILAQCTGDNDDLETLLSLVLLKISPHASTAAMCAPYGDTYMIGREMIEDAHTLAALIDACGKSGAGGLGASLCLRSSDGLEEAWEVAKTYRLRVIAALGQCKPVEGCPGVVEVDDAAVAADVADSIAYDRVATTPVFVSALRDDTCIISARTPPGMDLDLDALMRRHAEAYGGRGGGHRKRAGAIIPAKNREPFINEVAAEVAA